MERSLNVTACADRYPFSLYLLPSNVEANLFNVNLTSPSVVVVWESGERAISLCTYTRRFLHLHLKPLHPFLFVRDSKNTHGLLLSEHPRSNKVLSLGSN
jgi:hypothetical protein